MSTDDLPCARNTPYVDFLRSAMSTIPSVFGRLTCVAALKDPERDCYRHHDPAGAFPPYEVDEVLRRKHVEIFEAWLCLSLGEQAADLAVYLGKQLGTRREALRAWRQEIPYRRLIPASALPSQRELFRSDLEMVLNVISDYAP